MIIAYPQSQTRESYVAETTNILKLLYSEFGEDDLKKFVAEITAKIAHFIGSGNNDDQKRRKINALQELVLANNEEEGDQSELAGIMTSQASLSDGSLSSDDAAIPLETEVLSPLYELELHLQGNKIVAENHLKNKQINLNYNQPIERLQGFFKQATRKCIQEICNATLENSQNITTEQPTSPSPALLPMSRASRPLSENFIE